MAGQRQNITGILLRALAGTALHGQTLSFLSTTTQSRMIGNSLTWVASDCARHGLLLNEYSFYTFAGVHSYACPSDWYLPEVGTAWNRTTNRPIYPVTGRGWQELKSSSLGSGITQHFRTRISAEGGSSGVDQFSLRRIWIDPVPTSREQISIEYRSDYWLTDDTEKTITDITTASDTGVSIECASHGLLSGAVIHIYFVGGTVELNNRTWSVQNITDVDNFTLLSTDGDDFTTYTSGGQFVEVYGSRDIWSTADAVNWYPLFSEELITAGLRYRINMQSGLPYFEEKAEYEDLRDAFAGSMEVPLIVNMSSSRLSLPAHTPDSDYPSS